MAASPRVLLLDEPLAALNPALRDEVRLSMISSTVLTLLVIPALYSMWRGRQVRRDPSETVGSALD